MESIRSMRFNGAKGLANERTTLATSTCEGGFNRDKNERDMFFLLYPTVLVTFLQRVQIICF